MSVGASGPLVVTYPLSERSRAIVAEELRGTAAAVYLADLAPPGRAVALRGAGALFNAHYGDDPGSKFYTHLSDRFTPFYTKMTASSARGPACL
jgi:hypothetical protein